MYQDKPSIDELMHRGVGHTEYTLDGGIGESGRYKYGSGKNAYQHARDFMTRIRQYQNQGKSETEIAELMGIMNEKGDRPSTTRLRTQISLASSEEWMEQSAKAKKLRYNDDGSIRMSLDQVAKEMGFNNDSSVRALLDPVTESHKKRATATAEVLKKYVDEHGMLEVGAGVEGQLGVSKEKMQQALYILELEGYPTWGGGVPTGPNQQTNIKVLCPPGTEHKEIYDYKNIHYYDEDISYDNGQTFKKSFQYPESLDSKRLYVRYADEKDSMGVTGVEMDGIIQLRRGVPDLDLGTSNYAQVRIMVDDSHYLKGMAMYADDIPDGYDVVFNTNKKAGTPLKYPDEMHAEAVLKEKKSDPDNPFGSLIKEHGGQSYYDDPNGKYIGEDGQRQSLSLINKRADAGDWDDWSNKIPSQFLSKQSYNLIKQQLDMTIKDKRSEYEDIVALTNPTIKKQLLQDFADGCDAQSVNLKAAGFPNQHYKVLISANYMNEGEAYCPAYKDGTRLALIRYPHEGTFQIGMVTVNNKNETARRLLGDNPPDAIGVRSETAGQMSGADFDGDCVTCIPCNSHGKVKIDARSPLLGLNGYDPTAEYGPDTYRGKKVALMKKGQQTQTQMGIISNLINDMTIKNATDEELTRAVRHSMCVIDAAKHKLNYKQSEIDNDIAGLKRKYQGHIDEDGQYREGAATLMSRAKGKAPVLKRKGSPHINPETGELEYKSVVEYYDKVQVKNPDTGKWEKATGAALKGYYEDKKAGRDLSGYKVKTEVRMQDSTKMAETSDAFTLVSDPNNPHPKEILYANYANSLKAMANTARKEMLATGNLKYSPSAKKTYQAEYDHLVAQLNESEKNRPRERRAQTIMNARYKAAVQADPDLTKEERKKLKNTYLKQARVQCGAERKKIDISDKEWEAIQAGAITENTLTRILKYADGDRVRQLATPRKNSNQLSDVKIQSIQSKLRSGYSAAVIAEQMGISVSTVNKYANEKR